MINITAKLTAKEGKADEMQAALQQLITQVQANEPGVMQYAMHSVEGQPGVFLFYEQYADDEAFALHRGTEHMKALGAALADLSAARIEITRLNYIDGVKR
ncbi:MAG: antibiotic biosynthesis monooxygenase [Chloroflexi bacterium]|nr:antibiotic biosynthesis monooxygenase [Chloroflexota bacterium]